MLKENNLFPVSVDPVIFSLIDNQLNVLLVKRDSEVFNGFLSLPGGLMEKEDGSMECAVNRVLKNKTGAVTSYIEQLNTRTGHDPRGATISVSYIALVDNQKVLNGAIWMPVEKVRKTVLAFDHNDVVNLAIERLTNKVNYSTLPMHFLKRPFTLPKLQQVYEILLGEKLDKSTFRKKIEETNLLEDTGEYIKEGAFRPAKLYSIRENMVYNFESNIVRGGLKI